MDGKPKKHNPHNQKTFTEEMENHTKAPQESIQKERSTKACFIGAWKLFALNWRSHLRFTACHALLAGIGLAIFTYAVNRLMQETVLPAYLWYTSMPEPAMAREMLVPGWQEAAYTAAAFLAFLAGCSFWKAATFTQIRFYRSTADLPRCGHFAMRHAIRRGAARIFCFEAIALILYALIIGTGTYLALRHSLWYAIPAALLFAIVWVCALVARLYFVLHGQSLLLSWKSVFAEGYKRLGGYLIILLLTAIPVCWMAFVSFLPLLIVSFSGAYDAAGQLMGDSAAMPWYTGLLYLLSGGLCGTAYFLTRGLQVWALSLRFPYRQA